MDERVNLRAEWEKRHEHAKRTHIEKETTKMEPRRIVLWALLATVGIILSIVVTVLSVDADLLLGPRLEYAWFVLDVCQAVFTLFILPYTIYQIASIGRGQKRERVRRIRMRRKWRI